LEEDRKATDPWEKVELNKQFHLTLLSPSSMKRSLSIIADQYDGIARITQYMVVDHTKMVGKANSEHREIFKAVEVRDASLAVELMTNHINEATVRAQNELAPEEAEQE
jgi:DNA-binding GntR family transcriptional regulator